MATTPREVDVPADLASALAADDAAAGFFGALSNSLQRYHVDSVNDAKTPETRQRRIDKAVTLFREGKKRRRSDLDADVAAQGATLAGR